MKKMAMLFAALVFMNACGSAKNPSSDEAGEVVANSVTPAEITSAIIEAGEFPEMAERGLDDLAEYYFGIDLEGISEASYWIAPAGAYSDEITVIEADGVAIGRLAAFFEDWVKDRADMWRAYNPGQARKLDESVILAGKNGDIDYIAVFICDNPTEATAVFDGFMQ
ncbi:MAG: DUF4358 domain-containing protein [Oscillospiraceae bacterium]|nr:DUF4358 domain-containing protein [Oscillospiraceae bacterium]